MLRDEDGSGLVPSVVAYAADGSAIVGELARRLLLDRPRWLSSSIKRLMGRGAADLKALAGTLPYEIAAAPDDASKMVRVEIADGTLTPVEIPPTS